MEELTKRVNKEFKRRRAKRSFDTDPEKERSRKRAAYKEDPSKERTRKREAYKDAPEKERTRKSEAYKDAPEKERSRKREAYKDAPEKERTRKREDYKDAPEKERTRKREEYRADPVEANTRGLLRRLINSDTVTTDDERKKFEKEGRYGPIFPCVCCHQYNWYFLVTIVEDLSSLHPDFVDVGYVQQNLRMFEKQGRLFLCNRCKSDLTQGKCPKLSTKNNLQCPWEEVSHLLLSVNEVFIVCLESVVNEIL